MDHRRQRQGNREQLAEMGQRLVAAEKRIADVEEYLRSAGMATILDNYDYLLSLARDLNGRAAQSEDVLRQISAYNQLRERAIAETVGPEKMHEFAHSVEVKMAEIIKKETEPKAKPEATVEAKPEATPVEPPYTDAVAKARDARRAQILKDEADANGKDKGSD